MWREETPPDVSWHSHYGEQYRGSLKAKHRAIKRHCNSIPGHISREKHGMRYFLITTGVAISIPWVLPLPVFKLAISATYLTSQLWV